MKAMILAAGRGERMRPLTDHRPKPLLRAGGKALIEYHLEALQCSGFESVIINHAWLGEQFAEVLGYGERYGLHIEYSAEGERALETAGGILHALPKLGDAPFLVVNGDIWTDMDFSQLPEEPAGLMHMVLVNNPRHHPAGDFSLDDAGYVIDLPGLTFSGIAVYRPEFFQAAASIANGPVQPLAPLIRHWIAQQKVTGEHFQGRWADIGTPSRLAELDKQLTSMI